MKNTWKLFWGLSFILVAVLLVLDALGVFTPLFGVFGTVSIWAIVGGIVLLYFAISQLITGNIGNFFVPLAIIFMLFEKNVAYLFHIGDENGNIINNWLLLLVAVMLGVGFSILFSGIKRERRHRKHEHEWKHGRDTIRVKTNIGSSVRYIDCDGFKYDEVENDVGSCTVFFENVDKYESGGVLNIENNVGSTVVTVPGSWNVISKVENNLGSVVVPKPNPDGPILTVTGENNLGSICIKVAKKEADGEEKSEEPVVETTAEEAEE